MDESDLYRYALVAVIAGFLLLGAVVLFVPVSFDDAKADYLDGKVLQVFSSGKGKVVVVNDVSTKSFFLDGDKSIEEGKIYRFYGPTGDELLSATAVRPLFSED
ncbi:MAG: hypothetical protein KC535_02160 [Nanoarchaeota archaeon]|nr:hypothetical protein [Nanoarchaeota archaeon]